MQGARDPKGAVGGTVVKTGIYSAWAVRAGSLARENF